jgi:carbonic anhydrase
MDGEILLKRGGSDEANNISFLTISNQSASIIEDVRRIKTML